MAGGVVIEMSADEANLFRKLSKLEKKNADLRNQLRGVGDTSKKAFSVGKIKAFAGSFVTVSSAIAAASAALTDFRRLQDEAGRRGLESEGGLAQLAQLADTKKEMKSLVSISKDLFVSGGGSNLADAAGVTFALESAGILDQRDIFKQLGSRKIVSDPAALAKSATTLFTSIGEAETGSVRDIVSKAFAASKASPATVEALLEGAARSGVAASQLGVSDEEILAATALAATASGSAEQGGTQVNSLLRSLIKQGGFKGKSIRESVLDIQGKGLDDAELIKFFGRQEAATAFGVIASNLDQFDDNVASITRAQDQDLVGQKISLTEQIPEIEAARQSRIAQAHRELSEEGLGSFANLAQAVVDDSQAAKRRAGGFEFVNFLSRSTQQTSRFFQGDEDFLRSIFLGGGATDQSGSFKTVVGEDRFNELLAVFNRLIAETEEVKNNTAETARKTTGNPALAPANTDEGGAVMAGSIGGHACDFVKGTLRALKETVETWRLPGVDGYGAQLLGFGDSSWQFTGVLYDSNTNVEAWFADLEALQGSIISITDDWGETYSNFLVTEVGVPSKTPAIGAGGARGELTLSGLVV